MFKHEVKRLQNFIKCIVIPIFQHIQLPEEQSQPKAQLYANTPLPKCRINMESVFNKIGRYNSNIMAKEKSKMLTYLGRVCPKGYVKDVMPLIVSTFPQRIGLPSTYITCSSCSTIHQYNHLQFKTSQVTPSENHSNIFLECYDHSR